MAQYSLQLVGSSSQEADGGNYGDAGSAFTIAFWMKTTAIIGGFYVKSSGQNTTQVTMTGTKVVMYAQKDNNNFRGRISSTTMNNGAWHHVAYTYNGSTSTLLMYIDGSAETGTTDNLGTPGTVTNAGSVIVGNDHGNFVTGGIDDMRVWSRILSSTEIADLHTNPCTFVNGANMEAWWKFDNDYTDSSGNSRTLSAVNSPTFSSVDVPYATCPSPAKANQFFLM